MKRLIENIYSQYSDSEAYLGNVLLGMMTSVVTGSIASMFLAIYADDIYLMQLIIAIPTMASLVGMISVQPPKVTFRLSLFAISLNLIISVVLMILINN